MGSDGSDKRGSANEAAAHVVVLQHLYSIFLPPHLQLNEEIWEKHRKTKHTRVVIYTGKSHTSIWQKGVDQRKCAKGSAKLDEFGFVLRSVSLLSQKVLKPLEVSHFQQKRQRSPLPLEEDSDVEILDAGKADQALSNLDIEILNQPANIGCNPAVPTPGGALARSQVIDLTGAKSDEDLELVPDSAPPHAPPSIDIAVDQLTADLAAFCFNQLERSLTLGNEDHEVGSTNDFEGKLQVRSKLQRRHDIPIFDPFRSQRLWHRHMPPILV